MSQNARKSFARARSQAEKSDRREAILGAAERLVEETGVEHLSMNVLAARANVAKGTLYLYFATREELLLALYVSRLTRWRDALLKGTKKGMSDTAFCKLFLSIAQTDPLFIDLSSRLTNVIEKNVSVDSFSDAKREMMQIIHPLGARFESCLKLKEGEGPSVLTSFMALLLGAAQFDSTEIFPLKDLPDDVVEIIGAFRCDDVFLRFAPLILKSWR